MMPASEIAVVGGGPAGAVIALRLAELGHDVVLLEGARMPRPHIGEALTPGVAEQLIFLGLSEILERTLVRSNTVFELKWRTDRFEPHTAMKPGFLVDRGAFDSHLVAAARQRGVRVREATRALGAERTGGSWRVKCDSPRGPLVLAARMLIDATGRQGLLPKKRQRDYRLLVLHGRFAKSRLPSCVRVAASDSSWAWGAPMADGTYAAMVFLEPRDIKFAGKTLEHRFRNLVSACGLLDDGGPAEAVGPVEACDATPYVDRDPAGADFIKIGDASLAVDPISSAGVQLAIQSAIAGAAAVHTLRRGPEAAEVVTEFWSRELARRNARHRMWSGNFYREAALRFATPFWQTRATSEPDDAPRARDADCKPLPLPNQALRLASSVSIASAPCILENTIKRRRIVSHPSLMEPVAFLDEIDLPLLLARIVPGMTATSVLRAWSDDIDPDRAIAVLSWTWQRGLVEPLPN
jgi:flavin-dependent dehydrogenase